MNKDTVATPPLLIVGGERNEHGTRICRKVTCIKCHQVDYVSVSRAKKCDILFCRNCAKDEIRAHEKGTKIKCQTSKVRCNQCTKFFDFPVAMQKKGPLYCSDCFKGFEVWRGSREKPIADNSSLLISKRRAGTLLRTNKLDLQALS